MNLVLLFDKINKFSLYFALFLVPLLFLPIAQNVLDAPKQFFSLILIFLSLIGWLGKSIFQGKLVLKYNKNFYLALILILFFLLISSYFSVFREISFFGSPSTITDSLSSFVLFLVLAFLIVNSFEKEDELLPFLFFFLLAGAIAGILNLFQIYRVFLLPFDFAKFVSFNTIGSTNSLALFFAVLLPLSLILTFNSKGSLKKVLAIISVIFTLNLILINFKTAWAVLLAGTLFLFVFGLKDQKEKIKPIWLGLLMTGIILSVFFYFSTAQLPGFPILPPEVSLGFNSEAYILRNSFSQDVKNIFVGTGPGTFVFNYSSYKPALINQTPFWGTRFSEGSSFFLDWFLTKGILAGFSLVFLYLIIIYFALKDLSSNQNKRFYEIKLALASGLFGLILASFFYNFNFVISFTFWFLTGSFILFFSSFSKTKEIDISSHQKVILANFSLIIVIIFSLVIIVFQGQKYLAETRYLQSVQFAQAGNFDQAVSFLEDAVRFNPSFDVYRRDLAQLHLARTNTISEDLNLTDEGKKLLINQAIIEGAERVNQASEIGPKNVANWNVRGFFYRNLIPIPGATQLSIESYKRASQLEPTSPFIFGEIARIYLRIAQETELQEQILISKEESLNFAFENLKIAIELKPDYDLAHYLMAIGYSQKGETDMAILKLEETKLIAPRDEGVAFQLGLLYWREKRLTEAQEELERAIEINPQYADARYILGAVYDQRGEKEKAKQEFRKVLEADPKNKEIEKILRNIENGLPALEGISDLSEDIIPDSPTQTIPPEIQI